MKKYRVDKLLNKSRASWRKIATCKCGCGFDALDADMLDTHTAVLAEVASLLGVPHDRMVVYYASWNRCPFHNRSKAVGGVKGSLHERGQAADCVIAYIEGRREHLVPAGVIRAAVDAVAKRFGLPIELGLYPKGRVHIGVNSPGFWDAR